MSGPSPRESYSREEIRRMLDLSERQLKSWERQGLVTQADSYTFRDLLSLRTLVMLRQKRVPAARMRQAVSALRRRMGDERGPISEFRIFADGKRIAVQIEGQKMEPITGQLLLDFDRAELARLLSFPRPAAEFQRRAEAERLFQQGLERESQGAPVQEVMELYQRAVDLDPGAAGALVNLGTICFHLHNFAAAERYYRSAVEADPSYALAHFNLANLYDETGDRARALAHYLEAIRLDAGYADAHYNLALLYQSAGQVMKAVRHWQIYLKLDPASKWAAYARAELERLRSALVQESSRAGR